MRQHIAPAFIISLLVIIMSYIAGCQSNLNIKTAQYAVNGQKLYKTHCQNCHGGKGEGLGKLYPPLTDQQFLKDNRAKLSCIVKHGMIGEVTVSGQTYNEKMPANPQLTELDIAYLLTYITTHLVQGDSIYAHDEVKKALENCN